MTVDWTGPNQGRLRKTLLEIYGTTRSLRRFVRDYFEHSLADLPDIVGASPENWAEDLIDKAVSECWIDDLYDQFCTVNQSNPRITQLKQDLDDTFFEVSVTALVPLERVIGDPNSGDVVAREAGGLVEDPRSAYLVIAMFWQERSKKTFRVHPKLCYRDMAGDQVLHEPLLRDDCPPVPIKDFPNFLQELVQFAVQKLSRLFPDPVHPWKLTIALFVPIDLLCFPLSKWCGQESALLTTYPLVVGCSDRFDPEGATST